MVLTDDQALYDRIVSLRYNGTVNKEVCILTSLNGRLDTLQAAILLRRLARVPALIERRRDIARQYDSLLAGLNANLKTPSVNSNESPVYYTYTVLAEKRDDLKSFLEDEKGVECKFNIRSLCPTNLPIGNGPWQGRKTQRSSAGKYYVFPCMKNERRSSPVRGNLY